MRFIATSDDVGTPLQNTVSQDAVIEQHGSLVTKMAKQLWKRLSLSLSVDDLTQAGVIGLLEAAKNYKEEKGASFETYARIRIRGSILDEARKGDWAPRSVHRNRRRLSKAMREIEHKTGRHARDREVADHLALSLQEHHQMLQDTHNTRLSMLGDWDLEEGEASSVACLEPNIVESLEFEESKAILAQALETLPEREQQVLKLYYQEELNLKAVGKVLGVTESRISQIHSRAVQRIKSYLSPGKSTP